jgi:hypothetical protein
MAGSVLPSRYREWGRAMKAELLHIGDDRAALDHARGCLVAALRERGRDFETRFAAGLWAAALIGALFASFHMLCATRGIAVLAGAPDGFRAALVRGGASMELLTSYESARPIVIASLVGLAFAHLAGAVFLASGHLGRFLYAWVAAAAFAILAVAIQLSIVWTADSLPSEFAPFLLQSTLLVPLLLWSRGRHREKVT